MRRARPLLALAVALALAGCAGLPGASGAAGPVFADAGMSAQAADAAVAIGASRAELLARLGPAEVIRFDSGYEVWVWRAKGARGAGAGAELVVLFDPAGQVSRKRLRPAPATGVR